MNGTRLCRVDRWPWGLFGLGEASTGKRSRGQGSCSRSSADKAQSGGELEGCSMPDLLHCKGACSLPCRSHVLVHAACPISRHGPLTMCGADVCTADELQSKYTPVRGASELNAAVPPRDPGKATEDEQLCRPGLVTQDLIALHILRCWGPACRGGARSELSPECGCA